MGTARSRHAQKGFKRNTRVANGGFGTFHLLIVLVVSGWLAAYAGLKARDAAYEKLRYEPDHPAYVEPPPKPPSQSDINFN